MGRGGNGCFTHGGVGGEGEFTWAKHLGRSFDPIFRAGLDELNPNTRQDSEA